MNIKTLIRDIIEIFINYFVAYIPCWHIRRFFYKCFGMKIGKGSRICMKCYVMSPWKIVIGDNTMINEFSLLDGRGKLEIGNNCSISMWAIIYTASHYSNSPMFEYYTKKTIVEDCCWIGARAIVLPGCVLKERSIISANSVFQKGSSVESGIYVGNPAVLVKSRLLEINFKMQNCNYFR